MWLQLKTYKNMCSCSGSCNCNSTTIPRGPQGAPGQNGAAATIAVGSVTALPAGSTPTITNGGSSSAASFNFGIPAGATGATGPAGPQGPAGPSQIEVLGFDDSIRLTSVSIPGGYQNTSSFTIPANSIASINDWIEIEYTVKISFSDGWTGSPDIRSFQLQINPNGYGSTYSIGGISSGLFGVETIANFKLKLYYGGLNGISQTKLIGDSLAITSNSVTNIALNYTSIPGSGSAGDSYLVRTNQTGGITLFDGALYSWNDATSSWDGFTSYGTQSTRGFSLNTNSSISTTYDPIELTDDILITPRFQCYDTNDVVVTNFKITKYTT